MLKRVSRLGTNFILRRLISRSWPVYLVKASTLFFNLQPCLAQEIPDSLVKLRLQKINEILKNGKPNADQWWYGWFYGYTAATVTQLTVYFLSDDLRTRQDMALGASTTALGSISQLFTPNYHRKALIELNRMNESSSQERFIKLARAEFLLKETAKNEKFGKSWKVHALTGLVNVGSGMVTWLAFKRSFTDGVVNFAINSVITEVQIWTQPTRTLKDYSIYNADFKQISFKSANVKPTYYVMALPNGIAFRLTF